MKRIIWKIKNRLKYPESKIFSYIPKQLILEKHIYVSYQCVFNNTIKNIGGYTFFNNGVKCYSVLSIGRYCSISHDVKIGVNAHPHDWLSTSPVFYSPFRGYVSEKKYDPEKIKGFSIIENDVLIGASAIILAGVRISTGAIVGAGSVVTKDVPPYAIVAGNPAKIIRYRFSDDLILALLASKWWEHEIEDLKPYFDIMNKPIDIITAIK